MSAIHDAEAYNKKRDHLSYPPIPAEVTRFYDPSQGYINATVHYWEWSETFGKWGAFVTFPDGKQVYTYPKPDWAE